MWFARYFPGLAFRVEDVARLTPEQTTALHSAGKPILDAEGDERIAHTKVIAQSAGMRVF